MGTRYLHARRGDPTGSVGRVSDDGDPAADGAVPEAAHVAPPADAPDDGATDDGATVETGDPHALDELIRFEREHTPAAGSHRARRPSRFDRPKEPHDWRWVVGGIGRTLIAIGLLLFAFVGYQLWGTGIQTAQAQRRLSQEFDQLLDSTTSLPATSTSTTPSTDPTDSVTPDTTAVTPSTQPPPLIGPPGAGEPLARLDIPAIDLEDKIVIEGVSAGDLEDGPGHFPETPLPGQYGNSAIAGHRTTHGQPFYRIDELEAGDEIIVTTLAGRYVYVVTGQTIVGPDDYGLVIPTTDPDTATLTLTSCHPRYSAKQRIVIFSEIDPDQSALVTAPFSSAVPATPTDLPGEDTVDTAPVDTAPVTTVPDDTTPVDTVPATTVPATGPPGGGPPSDAGEDVFENRWFSDPDAWPQVALWGLVLAAVSLGAYAVARRARRYWVGALVGFAPFVVVLYFFFENVNRLLPPNL